MQEISDRNRKFYLKFSNDVTGPVYYVYYIDFINRKYDNRVGNFVCIDDTEKAEAIINAKIKEKEALRDNPCPLITSDYDEFDNTKTILTPLVFDETSLNCSFYKIINRGKTSYYLSLSTIGNIPLATEQGVIIILKNGKKIVKPAATVKTRVNNSAQYERSSFIQLTQTDILLLKSSPISRFKLYVDADSAHEPEILYKTFLCLLQKK